jgi:hypothetical protein
VEENRPFWLPVEAGVQDIRIVPDDRIPRAGCFVEADSTSTGMQVRELASRIDEELKTALAAKVQALKGPQAGASGTAPGARTA